MLAALYMAFLGQRGDAKGVKGTPTARRHLPANRQYDPQKGSHGTMAGQECVMGSYLP